MNTDHLKDWDKVLSAQKEFDKATCKKSLPVENPKEAVDKKQWRKERPLASGVLAYFPNALLEVAHTSFVGNEQHNKGESLHWAREKSTDQLDALSRHLLNHLSGEIYDTDGVMHLAKVCWRSLAELEILLEKK